VRPREALTEGFQRWLDEAVPSETANVKSEVLDPYRSSMRYPSQVREGLVQVRDNSAITTADPPQRFGDMHNAELVVGSPTTSELTPLGDAVVTAWNKYGVLDPPGTARELDFARSVIYLTTALRLSTQIYLDMLERWRSLRRDRPAVEWFADPWSPVAASYFRVERVGYNPYKVMLAAGCPIWAHRSDLEDWATVNVPPGWTRSRLGVVLKRIADHGQHVRGKFRFYQALEAVCLRDEKVPADTLKATFKNWGVDS
jgi:hypothetical protein